MRIKGGLPVSPVDNRCHGTFKHDPSTFRLSMSGAALHQIPRGSTELGKLVRGFFEAPEGKVFWARDFSGIEGVLTGFFANAPRIIRIFKLDGHSWFTANQIYELEKNLGLTYQDLPQESWSDADLRICLSSIKSRFKQKRETNKKVTHGANYMETAKMAQVILLNELGVLWPVKDIARIMEFYHDLFPEIRRWHSTLASAVGGAPPKCEHQLWGCEAKPTWIRGPFGLVSRFYNVVKWEKLPTGWDWDYDDGAKRLASLLPQSTARFIITRAAQRIWEQYPDVGKTFRLFIHDEIFGECLESELERCLQVSQIEQERPIPELVLPDGSLLSIGSEAKSGKVWGGMK